MEQSFRAEDAQGASVVEESLSWDDCQGRDPSTAQLAWGSLLRSE